MPKRILLKFLGYQLYGMAVIPAISVLLSAIALQQMILLFVTKILLLPSPWWATLPLCIGMMVVWHTFQFLSSSSARAAMLNPQQPPEERIITDATLPENFRERAEHLVLINRFFQNRRAFLKKETRKAAENPLMILGGIFLMQYLRVL